MERIKRYRGVYKESDKKNHRKQRRWMKKRRKDNSLDVMGRFGHKQFLFSFSFIF